MVSDVWYSIWYTASWLLLYYTFLWLHLISTVAPNKWWIDARKSLRENVILQTSEAEKELVAALPEMWAELMLKSKNVDASLIVVKKKFTEITQQQIKVSYDLGLFLRGWERFVCVVFFCLFVWFFFGLFSMMKEMCRSRAPKDIVRLLIIPFIFQNKMWDKRI